jgi:hypothetical protein
MRNSYAVCSSWPLIGQNPSLRPPHFYRPISIGLFQRSSGSPAKKSHTAIRGYPTPYQTFVASPIIDRKNAAPAMRQCNAAMQLRHGLGEKRVRHD